MKEQGLLLVVDDNRSRRNWICHVLGTLPYLVVAVPSAHQALRSLKKIRANAVVVGEELRGRSLYRFQAVMRRRYPDIPVVVASCPWIRRDVMTMSPGAYHCLVLCTQSHAAALLRGTVRRALEAQSASVGTSAERGEKKYACV